MTPNEYQVAWQDGFRSALNFCLMYLSLDSEVLRTMAKAMMEDQIAKAKGDQE